jgi:hypothetical protein
MSGKREMRDKEESERKVGRENEKARSVRQHPVSLAPLSFEDAVRALAATPPMKDKPKRQPAPRRKKPNPKQTG